MKNQVFDSLLDFSSKRAKLQGIYSDADGLLEALKMDSERKSLSESRTNLDADTFKVLVIGEFKRGKSTFINALLGEEVLPSFSIPCTAVINEIKYSEQKRAVLHFQSPLPASRPKLADDVEKHIAAHADEASIPPMEIPVERIEEFVVIPDPGKDQAESVSESPFAKVDIFWPIDLCKNKVEIIDSPGLNEHGTRTKVTTDYLSKVDAVIFVLSCSALASESELNVIDDAIIGGGHEEIFFVCNRFDEIRERDRQKLVEYGHKRLEERTKLGSDGILFLSSRDALDAKLDKDAEALQSSGFPKLEQELVSFLVHDRGRMKLLRPANALRRQLNKAIREVIPMRRAMLSDSLAELERKYGEAKPRLDAAEKRRSIIQSKIETESLKIRTDAKDLMVRFVKDCADEVPNWLSIYKPKQSLTFISLESTKTQCGKLAQEQLEYVQHKIAEKQKAWLETVFRPRMEQGLSVIRERTSVDMDEFFAIVDEVRMNIKSEDATKDQRDIPGWERVVAAGAGLLLWSEGSAMMGAMGGFKGLVQSLLPQFGVIFGLLLLGVTNPWIFIPALLGAGGIQAMFSNKSMEKKLRDTIVRQIQDSLRKSAEESAEDSAKKIDGKLADVRNGVNKELNNEIQTIRESVESILKSKRKGEADTKSESERLDEQFKTAGTLLDQLDELSDELAVPVH